MVILVSTLYNFSATLFIISDIRLMEHVKGRSINLALSIRGKAALEYVGLKDYIMDQGVKMFDRFVHDQHGVTTNTQPYGKPGEVCYIYVLYVSMYAWFNPSLPD